MRSKRSRKDTRKMPPTEDLVTWCWVDAFLDFCRPPKDFSPQERQRWMEQQSARLDDLAEAGG